MDVKRIICGDDAAIAGLSAICSETVFFCAYSKLFPYAIFAPPSKFHAGYYITLLFLPFLEGLRASAIFTRRVVRAEHKEVVALVTNTVSWPKTNENFLCNT